MTFREKQAALLAAIKAVLQPRLNTLGLPDFETWLADTPRDTMKREFGVFMGPGEETMEERQESYLIHATLPEIETPYDYAQAILDSVRDVRPKVVEMQTREMMEWEPLASGMDPEGGYGSFIQVAIVYTKQLDDCD